MPQQEVTLTVLTTGATRYVVLAEREVEGKALVAVVDEQDFEQGMENLHAGVGRPNGPTFRWMERRGDELFLVPADLAITASRLVASELASWLEAGETEA